MKTILEINESVQYYYGQVQQSSNDLKTSACCSEQLQNGLSKKI